MNNNKDFFRSKAQEALKMIGREVPSDTEIDEIFEKMQKTETRMFYLGHIVETAVLILAGVISGLVGKYLGIVFGFVVFGLVLNFLITFSVRGVFMEASAMTRDALLADFVKGQKLDPKIIEKYLSTVKEQGSNPGSSKIPMA